MSNKEFISDRTEHLAQIRELLTKTLPEFAQHLPEDHSSELDPKVASVACSVLDAVRCYVNAAHHFDGPEAAKAQLRQIHQRDEAMREAAYLSDQTPAELGRMAAEQERLQQATAVAIEGNGGSSIYRWAYLNQLEAKYDVPASLIYEALDGHFGDHFDIADQ